MSLVPLVYYLLIYVKNMAYAKNMASSKDKWRIHDSSRHSLCLHFFHLGKFRKKFYLVKQILSKVSLVQFQFDLSRASGKWLVRRLLTSYKYLWNKTKQTNKCFIVNRLAHNEQYI
jgi:hypothetical protein